MNFSDYLPFVGNGESSLDSKDSEYDTYGLTEDTSPACELDNGVVIHDFKWEKVDGGKTVVTSAWQEYTDGHVILPVKSEKDGTCQHCGETVHSRMVSDGKLAIPVAYEIDEDVSISDAITTTAHEEDGESDSILVNEREVEF